LDISEALTDLQVTNGQVWMYVGKPDYLLKAAVPREQAAILRKYIGYVEAGLDELGLEFRHCYEHSSDPVPESNVIDEILG
jgi:hypothetical protein